MIGICSNVLQSGDNDTGDLEFPDTPDGGVKLWYNSAMDFGMVRLDYWRKVFQLGSTNLLPDGILIIRQYGLEETHPL
mgnify:CR=1 FL=1